MRISIEESISIDSSGDNSIDEPLYSCSSSITALESPCIDQSKNEVNCNFRDWWQAISPKTQDIPSEATKSQPGTLECKEKSTLDPSNWTDKSSRDFIFKNIEFHDKLASLASLDREDNPSEVFSSIGGSTNVESSPSTSTSSYSLSASHNSFEKIQFKEFESSVGSETSATGSFDSGNPNARETSPSSNFDGRDSGKLNSDTRLYFGDLPFNFFKNYSIFFEYFKPKAFSQASHQTKKNLSASVIRKPSLQFADSLLSCVNSKPKNGSQLSVELSNTFGFTVKRSSDHLTFKQPNNFINSQTQVDLNGTSVPQIRYFTSYDEYKKFIDYRTKMSRKMREIHRLFRNRWNVLSDLVSAHFNRNETMSVILDLEDGDEDLEEDEYTDICDDIDPEFKTATGLDGSSHCKISDHMWPNEKVRDFQQDMAFKTANPRWDESMVKAI